MAFPALSVRVHRRRFVRYLMCRKFHMFEIPDECCDVKGLFSVHLCQLYVLKIWLLSRHHVRSEGFLLISSAKGALSCRRVAHLILEPTKTLASHI